MKKSCHFLLIICLLFTIGCNKKEKFYYSSPSVIPNTLRQMKSPGFWISRHNSVDKVILDYSGIILLNLKIENELKFTKDLIKIGPAYPGKELAVSLREEMDGFFKQKLYSKDLRRVGRSFYRKIEKQVNFEAIPSRIYARYGFICRYAEQRVMPTEEALTNEPGDLDFDKLQNSSLDIGTPLVILHESKDSLWAYAYSPTSSGWVKKDCVAFCDFSYFKAFLEKTPFIVVINAKADIFLDPGLTQYLDYVRMGAKFPIMGEPSAETISILVPSQTKEGSFTVRVVYLKRSDVSFGYLAYTPRNIIQQAFKLLNAPYGWGGKNGEQDCSSFIQEIFSTAGIVLPRNSSEQGKIGQLLGGFSEKAGNELKSRILNKQAIPGVTVLQLEGHILLYLGMFENRPYAIHETHGYRQKQRWGRDTVREVNRVVVSDLSLGEGSQKGSLFDRIISIRSIN